MSSPTPIFGTQDLKDDDGQVIDSFFIETDTPPDLKAIIEPVDPPASAPIRKPTRMMAGTEIITSATVPYMLVPADPDRIKLHVDTYSYAVTPGQKDYVLVGDENGKVSNGGMTQGAFRARHNKGFDLDDHTGAIWIGPGPILTDNFEISWRMVTK